MPRTPFSHLHLRIPPDQKDRLDAETRRTGMTANELVSRYIAEKLGGPVADSPRGPRPRKA